MKTRYGTWLSALAAAALFACGGSQQGADNSKQQVTVETNNVVVGDVASVSIVASLSGTVAFSGALTYDASKGKFTGSIFLAPNATPYDLVLTALKADGTTVLGTASGKVTVSATSVASITLNIASILEALPTAGFVITSFQATGYVDVNVAAPFSVTTAQAGTAPALKWTASTGCVGSFAPSDTAASVTFTGTTAEICTISVKVTDSGNNKITASKSGQIGIGQNVSVGGTFIPSPTITQVVLLGNGGYDGTWDMTKTPPAPNRPNNEAACTLLRVSTATVQASQACTGTYKIGTGLASPFPEWDGTGTAPALPLIAPQFGVAVTYDLGGIFDPANPPKIGVTASCPNSATNGISRYTPESPIAGSGPGTATCPAAPAVCIGSTNVYWTEPIAFNAPATSDLCTLTVSVNNQGSLDSFPVRVFISQ